MFLYERLFLLSLTMLMVVVGFSYSRKHTHWYCSRTDELPSVYYLTLLFLFSFLVRIYSIDFDVPYNFHHDERWKIAVVKNMILTGDLNPHYFNHPSLLLYLTKFCHFFLNSFFNNLDLENQIKMCGRLISVVSGSFSVILLVILSRKFVSLHASYMCGVLFSVFPLSILGSMYLKEDMLFVCLLLLFLNACILRSSATKSTLIGLSLGLCCGSKYTGALLFLFTIPLLFTMTLKEIFLLFIALCVGFVSTTPYALLDYSSFIEGVLYEKRHMSVGNTIPISFSSQFGTYHLVRSILYNSSLLFWLVAAAGFGGLLSCKKYLPCIVFTVFYCAAEMVKAKIEPEPARYILPCIPFVCLSVAYVFDQGRVGKLIFFAILTSISVHTFEMIVTLPHDSRLDMLSYINEEIPYDKKILIDHRFNNPQFNPHDPRISYLSVRPLTRGYPEVMNKRALTEMNIDYVLVSNLTYQCLYFCKESTEIEKRSVKRLFANLEIVHDSAPKHRSFGYHDPHLTLFKVSSNLSPESVDKNLNVLSRGNPFTYNLW